MKKKTFPIILLIISLLQFILCGLFVISDEFIATDFAINGGMVMLVASIIVYFIIKNKTLKNLKLVG